MVTDNFEKKNFMQHALMMGPCFFFWGGGGVGWGELLLLVFPWSIFAPTISLCQKW